SSFVHRSILKRKQSDDGMSGFQRMKIANEVFILYICTMIRSVYIDTSVFGGFFEDEFKEGYQMTEIRTPKEIFPHED
ncbi:MAG: hypothetical protein KKB74_06875, partial [Bacteroidetes bacterium]|nr:hypothetical protein [Bacteroidota bacterium]